MRRQIISIGEKTFLIINAPLLFFNIAVNVFFACCLMIPLGGRQRITQPLKTLLELIVWCSIFYFAFLAVFYIFQKSNPSHEYWIAVFFFISYFAQNSPTCYVWLNFYYYIQIVPVHRAFLIWIKGNIKTVIYSVLIFERVFFFLRGIVIVVDSFRLDNYTNGTMTGQGIEDHLWISNALLLAVYLYIVICLGVMTVSSFFTVRYLHRHMRNMAQQGNHLTTTNMKSQMRVTICGIVQGVLYLLYYAFDITDTASFMFSSTFSFSSGVSLTAISLYLSGTTINLVISQRIFRQKLVGVCKALRALNLLGWIHDVKQYPNSNK